jgi:hypothetical protein
MRIVGYVAVMTTARQFLIATEAGIAIRTPSEISKAVGTAFGTAGLIITDRLSPRILRPENWPRRRTVSFTNYGLRLILIVGDPEPYGDRFTELARDHRSHDGIRIVRIKDEANTWAHQLISIHRCRRSNQSGTQ